MELVVSNIRKIMSEKGLKQKYVAEKSDLTEQQFSDILNERKQFKVDYVLPICYALNIKPNELFQRSDDTHPTV